MFIWLLWGSGVEMTLPLPLQGSRFVPFLPSSWSLSAACGSGGRSSGATPVSVPPPPSASSTPAGQPTAISRLQMQLHLRGLQNSTSDLRGQLQQLRKLQVLPPARTCPVPRPTGPAPQDPPTPAVLGPTSPAPSPYSPLGPSLNHFSSSFLRALAPPQRLP